MRILVISKGSGQGAGASQATRYVARRKEGTERGQESEATRMFSAQAESLGDQRANLVLGAGSVPQTKDVMHLVISFAHEEDLLALGEDETARQQAVRDLTRATLAAASDNLKTDDLRWVAGIHRNTDNPHIHLLIHRDYHDRASGRAKRLSAVPAAWQVRWENTPTGERQTQPGELARTFESLLEERLQRLEPSRNPHQAARTEEAMARLAAQRFLAQARLQTEQEKAAQFAATQHLIRWKIADESGLERETTLAATERALRWAGDQAKFIGRSQVHWNDQRRKDAALRVVDLITQRAEIEHRIEERQQEYAVRVARQQAFFETLHAIYDREARAYQRAGKSLPPARFTNAEMRTLDRLAQGRGDPAFYRTFTQLERAHDARASHTANQPSEERLGRASARVVLAEIAAREAAGQLQNFQLKRDRTDVLLPAKTAEGYATARLADVQPRSRLARAFPSFTTQSEPYQTVFAALTEHEQRLTNEFAHATEARAVLQAVAREYAEQIRQQSPAAKLPPPHFSPAEKQRLVVYLEKETDPVQRARYAAFLREGEPSHPGRNVHDFISERAESRTSAAFVYDSLAAVLPQPAAAATLRENGPERENRFDR